MKIVHIITRLVLGGAQENTLITCRLLAQRGHDVTLITGPAEGPEGALFEQAGQGGYEVIVTDKLRRAINPLHDVPAYFELKKLLRKLRPDIVHTHSAKAGILGRYAGWAIKEGGKPGVVHTVHGLAFHPYESRFHNALYIAAERAAGRRTDAFITVADVMTQKARAAGIGFDKPWTTAYSAIDEDAFLAPPTQEQVQEFRRQYDIAEDAVVIVKIARLFELKGHEYVIESAKTLAAEHPDVIWLFVGDGVLMKRHKEAIRRAGLEERFRFTGLMRPERIPLAIHASDILVHCSLREGLARVLPQAMLCGKPAVSFDIDGAKEVVNERTGFLIEPENVGGLVNACRKLITDADLRKRLGAAGRESVREKFSPETMVNNIDTVYKSFIK